MLEQVASRKTSLEAAPSERSAHWYSTSARHQWRLVAVLLIVGSLGAVDRQVITLLVNPIRATLHITDVQVSLIVGAAFALSNTLFTLPAGYLADRLSRRGLIACAILVWSLFTTACGMVGSFALLFLCRIGVGFGESVIQPCALSMLQSAVSPERRGRAFAVQSMGAMGGSALALMIGGLVIGLIQRSGIDTLPLLGPIRPWQITLVLVGLLGLPIPLLLLTVREPPRGAPTAGAQASSLRQACRIVAHQSGIYVPLLVFQLGMTLLSLSYAAWIAALIGRTWHLSYAQIGTGVGLMMLLLPPVGLWAVGHMMDRLAPRMGVRGPVLVGLVATVLVGVVATIVPLAPTLPLFWASFAGLCLVSGTVFPVNATVMASITPATSMGSIAGLQFFVTGLVAAGIGPTLVASLGEALPGPRALAEALSLTCGAYSLIALAALAKVYVRILRA